MKASKIVNKLLESGEAVDAVDLDDPEAIVRDLGTMKHVMALHRMRPVEKGNNVWAKTLELRYPVREAHTHNLATHFKVLVFYVTTGTRHEIQLQVRVLNLKGLNATLWRVGAVHSSESGAAYAMNKTMDHLDQILDDSGGAHDLSVLSRELYLQISPFMRIKLENG